MEESRIFHYKPKDGNLADVSFPISLPNSESLRELSRILLLKNNLPIYATVDLTEQLCEFIKELNLKYYDERTTKLLQEFKNLPVIEDTTKEWDKLIKEETVEYGDRRCASDEELFATAYHKLVHSPALETMLQLECMYAISVRERVNEKDFQIKNLSEKQTEEMSQAVDQLEVGITELEINEMATRHFEDQSFLRVQLTSELETIKETQRREYREWLMQMLEESQASNSLLLSKTSPSISSIPSPLFSNVRQNQNQHQTSILEESFTIHLGSQLKQMHNIRILSADVMDLCAIQENEELADTTPQLLQTALGLYSNDLCGLVLMTDNVIGSRLCKEFTEICQRTTEFHFPYIDDQLERVSSTVQKYQTDNTAKIANSKHLQPGDVYITRHSNLAQVHVIFHMVSDDSLYGNDINSRHPVVLGLRNILKSACSNDVTFLTIPLLLQYEMSEGMTVTWCTKRAELVFKCVKGFMIEMASWGGSDLKNLQFLLPKGISSDVFQSLTTMLPNIFKVSNPLILKSNS
ncbi:hypothetical protein PPYR_05856 [Photinus pyralis]|uniref:Uncharacterized protein n=2 Tax=Photinus pyralis TaxID=7054 RepID=A0A1Y1N9I2_PHOPY|nr:protein C12orf4 homolog [Photinus pyralis]KAB0801496.1 hypothetical protein PPYR_05850 [Photinus pyralis]KAB0801502.1 hypothetical protein PPYR_05856 [Photinus pyralis]